MEQGIPIFVSECAGMEASGNGPIDETSWKEYIDWMESHKISWVVWSISDKDETCSMLLPRASATGDWSDDLLKKWGKITKQTVLERQAK
jgi:endoglucanase